MIEDKTKEPQTAEPAQQPPKKRGQKLRSLWAQFQCMQLLRRHRFRRRTQHHVNHFSQKLLQNRLVLIVGEALYALGFSAEYAFVRVGRTVCRGVSGALLWGRSLLHTIVSMAFPGAAQMVSDLFGPIVLFFRGMGSLLVHAHRVRKEKGFGAAVKDSVHYLVGGVRRNVRTLPRMAMYILPVLALAGMVTVVQNTIRQPYALEVQVNGGGLPPLDLSVYYSNLLLETPDEEVRLYLSEKLNQARSIVENINGRQALLERCAKKIVAEQEEFFRKGHGYLRPLELQQAADALGVSKEWIRCAVKDKYLQCPQGIYPMSWFFTRESMSDE